MASVRISAETIQRQIESCQRLAGEVESQRKNLLARYQQAGQNWNDRHYHTLGNIINECCSVLGRFERELLSSISGLKHLHMAVRQYEDTSITGGSTDIGGGPNADSIRTVAGSVGQRRRFRQDDNGQNHMYYDTEHHSWRLSPNCKYQKNGYNYQTDEHGRIIHADGKLHFREGSRQSLNASVEDMLPGDQRGHLFADLFGGSNQVDNLIAQMGEVNQGRFRSFERTLAEAMSRNETVYVRFAVRYEDDSRRPSEIRAYYSIGNGRVRTTAFDRFSNI